MDLVLKRYGVADEETFEVHLPEGDVLRFRALGRYSELKAFNRAASDWYASLPEPGSPVAKKHPWRDHLPRDAQEAIAAYTISELSIEPKIEHLDALRMLKAPWLIEHIMQGIERGSKTTYSRLDAERVETAKNGSGATDGTESD